MLKKFSWKHRIKSFHFALQGMRQFLSTQHNALLHAIATGLVILAGFLVALSITEWLFIVIITGLVWVAELFNTSIEKLCDMVSAELHPQIKYIKDVSAAAVLVTAIIALIIGLLIFIPKLL